MAKKNPAREKAARERYRQLIQTITDSVQVPIFETELDQLVRKERAASDYGFFVGTYFPNYATSKCADFHLSTADKIKADRHCKLLLGWGRGLAKSIHLDIFIPLWLWINNELKVMLLVGQTKEKADILLSDLQAQFEANQLLIHDWGAQRTQGSWEQGRFVTQNDCAFFSIGVGQSPRGIRYRQYRPDYIVADDLDTRQIAKNPKRVEEFANWICEELIPTTDIRGSRYIQVNNVFAEHTILSHIRDSREGFEYIQVNATDKQGNPTWYQKYTKEYYAKLSRDIGVLSFEAEYNNTPYAAGTIFKEEYIQWGVLPPLKSFERVIAHWDVAYSDSPTADFNAVRVWGLYKEKYYLIDCFVRQCKMADAIKWMYMFRESVKEEIKVPFYFESQFWNEALQIVMREVYNEVKKLCPEPLRLIKSTRTKIAKFDRIMTLLPYYQHGQIIYNIAHKTSPSFQIGVNQLKGIEEGYSTHDDAPDADADAIEKLSKVSIKKTNTKRYKIGEKANRKY